MNPHFLVFGAQKCGTSALYKYLVRHPQIQPAVKKELHFFDWKFSKGMGWYRQQFPLLSAPGGRDSTKITGEATPMYLFHPLVARRVARLLPGIRLVILLRNPVDRAYSHYQHVVRQGSEKRSFQRALQNEEELFEEEVRKIKSNPSCRSLLFQQYTYLSRGKYFEQIERLYQYIPRSNVLIVNSETFFSRTEETMNEIFTFLGLGEFNSGGYPEYKGPTYEPMDRKTRAWLCEYYEEHNRNLYALLGEDYGWE